MSKKKPIEIIKNYNLKPSQIYEKDGGLFTTIEENIISQIIETRDEEYYKFLTNEIKKFMISNNISTCFVLNKEELIDCLQEHNELHCKINNLQSQLDQQKAMWNELKEWLKESISVMSDSANYRQKEQLKFVVQKMQELEAEE